MGVRKTEHIKAIYSVKELCQILQISRARYYQLMEKLVFPPPVYDLRNQRPIYTAELKDQCLKIRETGIDFTGKYIMFYTQRKDQNNSNSTKKSAHKKSRINPKFTELRSILNQMGIDVSIEDICEAVEDKFPDGIEDFEIGVVARDIFRHLKTR